MRRSITSPRLVLALVAIGVAVATGGLLVAGSSEPDLSEFQIMQYSETTRADR
ncbi:hypothetical protein [Herbidospora sp. NBRC 101105]|uniref:hypothetical protein n=1 Tax=Herbidospora sp. NBRC 101105 TaxID=3032195 RepID=UPI0025531159|nr:hypothetical protein [Herbidospora sp. NBRC 101105]